MRAKKVIDFLILRPALTKKNFSSLGLVGLFFGIYVLLGGKVTWVPTVPKGDGFGTVTRGAFDDGLSEPANDRSESIETREQPPASRARLAPAPAEVPAKASTRTEAEKEWDRLEERLKKLNQKQSPSVDAASVETAGEDTESAVAGTSPAEQESGE